MLHRHAGPAVAGSYTAGAVTGALVTGAALLLSNGLLSPLPAQVRAVVAISALLLLITQLSGLLCLDLPENPRQIPRETFQSSPARAAFRFAFELGTGVRTYVTANAPYGAALVIALLLPSDLQSASLAALAVTVGYGAGRSIVVASQSLRRGVAVEHPKPWLQTADLVSLTFALILAIKFLTEQ